MGAFICQLSETDWLVTREIGVYGNREGSDRTGKVVYFTKTPKGDEIIQSIIEDLVGMKKGDTVFFHVINTQEGESSVHGIYRVSEEPFYNNSVKFWKSSDLLIYPYRFCFEPHPEHGELCAYDANVLVSEFYRSIENRDIRSILTLEREVRGSAHAVKTITTLDAKEIEKLLYRDFTSRRLKEPVEFKPMKMSMTPLRNHIQRIGEVEFAVKALAAYHLGQKHQEFIQFIPACESSHYDFLIETFIGQTMRRPVDLLCISVGSSEKTAAVTIIEAKTDLTELKDLTQSLRYLELYKLRNVDRGSLSSKTSICLLAQRCQRDLINYASVRNAIMPWEKVILLRYEPSEDGKNATFKLHPLTHPSLLGLAKTRPQINVTDLDLRISRNAESAYLMFGKTKSPRIGLESEPSEQESNIMVMQKSYRHDEEVVFLSEVFVYRIRGTCGLQDFSEFMKCIRREAEKFQGDLMSVEPIIIAEGYDPLADFFIEKYNEYETKARRQPISAYVASRA